MSNFYTPSIIRVSRKDHRCSYCGELIPKKSFYTFQKGNWDGSWFESKFHHECFEALCEDGDGEYTPYSNERPYVETIEDVKKANTDCINHFDQLMEDYKKLKEDNSYWINRILDLQDELDKMKRDQFL